MYSKLVSLGVKKQNIHVYEGYLSLTKIMCHSGYTTTQVCDGASNNTNCIYFVHNIHAQGHIIVLHIFISI